MAELIPITSIKGAAGAPGPAGQDATNAAEDAAALADFVNRTAGANVFADALDAKYLNAAVGSEDLLAYAENRTAQGTTAPPTGNWAPIVGVQLHVPPTTRDVMLYWACFIGLSVPGQGAIDTAPWDITLANDVNVFVAGGMAITRCLSNSVLSSAYDTHHGFTNIGQSATDRVFALLAKTTQEGSSLAGYVKNGVAGYDHTWMAAVMQ